MKRIFKCIFEIIAYIFATICCLIVYSFKSFTTARIIGKISIALSYVGVILSFCLCRKLFWGIMTVLVILSVLMAVYCYRDDKEKEEEQKDDIQADEVTLEYKRLLKECNTDNEKYRDLDKTLEIAKLYSKNIAKLG